MGRKIMLLHRPGITEYDPALRRNLTNDEWSLKQLAKLGVARQDIEFIPVPRLLFGTFSEAKKISEITSERRLRELHLVCSSYHSKRVWLTFSAFLEGTGVDLKMDPAAEKADCGFSWMRI